MPVETPVNTLSRKLHPARFPGMSPKMAAIVACILGESWAQPRIVELAVTSDGCFLARHEGDIGFNDFMGSASDLRRNWTNLLSAADLDPEERTEAERLFSVAVREF